MPDTANPRSWWVRFRLWLADRIEPEPDLNEAWCIRCELNDRKTRVIPIDGQEAHARLHAGLGGTHWMEMRSRRATSAPEAQS